MTTPRYRPVRKIATGGMAEVFLAIQQGLGGFEKLVVVKRILPHLSEDGKFIQMFLEEAKLAAALSHPNIVEIYDIQRDDEGFFIAMEYLSGEDMLFLLKTFAERQMHMPVPVTCRILSHAAAGLAAAHESIDAEGQSREVVHRDISPGNLILTYEGITKLVDFGVAKANVANIYTRPGTLKGKLSYASPEQVQHKTLDGRSDLFSLGIVGWQLLTGCKLFDQKSEASKVRAVMEEPIPPPSELNFRVPKELDEVVLSCLERDRRNRVQSATKLRYMLRQVSQDKGWATTAQDVGEWLRAALPHRLEERQTLEREVILQGREASAEEMDVTLPPFFPGAGSRPGSAGTPSSMGGAEGGGGAGSAGSATPTPTPPEKPRVGRIVLITVLITLVMVILAGIAFWMGGRAMTPAPATPPRIAVIGPRSLDKALSPPPVVATPFSEADAGAPRAGKAEEAEQPATTRSRPRRKPARPRRPSPETVKEPVAVAPSPSAPPAPNPAPNPAPEPAPAPEPPTTTPTITPTPAPEPRKPDPVKPVATHGTLKVASDAAGYLFIDGENTGKTTPVKIRLPVGPHDVVVLFKATNLQVKQRVVIKPGKVIKLRLRGTP